MINIQTSFEKSALYTGQKEAHVLIELTGQKKTTISKRPRFNLALVIDVSVSMDTAVSTHIEQVKTLVRQPVAMPPEPTPWKPYNPVAPIYPVQPYNPQNPQGPWLGNAQDLVKMGILGGGLNIGGEALGGKWEEVWQMVPRAVSVTRLDQAKEAAQRAVQEMALGDRVCVVAFDDQAQIVCESVEVTQESKKDIIAKIQTMKTRGSTDLHKGWLAGATQVARKMSSDFINRVILLTDGQTNAGIKDPVRIAQDTAGLYDKSISTTTFGIGKDFNEDLLQKMATSGGGNFYYINDVKSLPQMFQDEFNGLSNVCATQVQMALELKSDMAVLENMNGFEVKDGKYLIPHVQLNHKTSALFKLKVKTGKGKNVVLGNVVVSYKDTDGMEQKVSVEVKMPVVAKEHWDTLSVNEELKVQETLQVIAKNQVEATRSMDAGDWVGARAMLAQSSLYANASGVADARLSAVSSRIDSSLLSAQSDQELRKDVTFQSYQNRYNKLK